jgi:outer membrane protein assembly factor BamB
MLPLLTALASASAVSGANWPAWRGPLGTGVTAEKNLPRRWSTNQNVRWRAPLPDRGNSTPIVWGDRVFITQAVGKENRRALMCFARRDGKLLWQAGVTWTEQEPSHDDNPPCAPSPVTDGRRVIAWFGSAGVFCHDFAGRELWRRDLGRQKHMWGYGSSPVLHRDLCLLNFGPGDRSFLIALEKKTGRTIWQVDVKPIDAAKKWRDFGGPQEHGDKPGSPAVSDLAGSWSTPLVLRAAGREELIVPLPLRLLALDPKSGRELWRCEGLNIANHASPVFGEGVLFMHGSGFTNVALALTPGGHGDVTATHRLWENWPSLSHARLGSGVIHQGHLYVVTMAGFAQCLDLKSGKLIWDERLKGSGARNGSWSSLLLAGDRLYVPNKNADVFVLRAGPKFELLALNSLGGEPMNASLAVSEGDIFIRTDQALWCVSNARQRKR